MDERNAELKRLERELLADEEETMDLADILGDESIPSDEELFAEVPAMEFVDETTAEDTEDIEVPYEGSELSVDDILQDEELNALLSDVPEPAFEDPDQTRAADGDVPYNNFANDYGKEEQDAEAAEKAKNDKVSIGLMLGACGLCLGIIGILIYWICVLP